MRHAETARLKDGMGALATFRRLAALPPPQLVLPGHPRNDRVPQSPAWRIGCGQLSEKRRLLIGWSRKRITTSTP